jgi:hypothetical protein
VKTTQSTQSTNEKTEPQCAKQADGAINYPISDLKTHAASIKIPQFPNHGGERKYQFNTGRLQIQPPNVKLRLTLEVGKRPRNFHFQMHLRPIDLEITACYA